jgi:hypothetical protein
MISAEENAPEHENIDEVIGSAEPPAVDNEPVLGHFARCSECGGFKNSLSTLRQAGLVVGENTGIMRITDAGVIEAGPVEPRPTGAELARYWMAHSSFGKCEQAILGALLDHLKGLTAEKLCEITNYQYSGGFKNSLSTLRTAGVIVGKNTEVMRASEELFS